MNSSSLTGIPLFCPSLQSLARKLLRSRVSRCKEAIFFERKLTFSRIDLYKQQTPLGLLRISLAVQLTTNQQWMSAKPAASLKAQLNLVGTLSTASQTSPLNQITDTVESVPTRRSHITHHPSSVATYPAPHTLQRKKQL